MEIEYAVVEHGRFSGANERIRRALADSNSAVQHVINVEETRRFARRVVLNVPPRGLVAIGAERGLDGLRRPASALRDRRWTAFMYRWRSEQARAALARYKSLRFILQTQTILDASVQGIPFFIYTDHTVLANRRYPRPPQLPFSAEWIRQEGITYRRAARIFTMSEFAARSLIEDYGCSPATIDVIGSAACITPSHPMERDRDVNPFAVLFVGIDWERKGGPVLAEAFGRVRRAVPEATLRIVGCSPVLEGPGIEVIGRLTADEVRCEYERASIFCMPSWVEPSAQVFLEAAAFGLPVVATTVGGTPERVWEGRTGFLLEPGDVSGLADRMIRLMKDPERARQMGRAGAERAAGITWELVAQRMWAGIDSVLGAT